MLHAAIYRAEPGSVIVVESGDTGYALAGGNVCAVAHRRGVEAFVLDGVIRDVGEIRADGFPVHARGVVPIPGVKKAVGPLNEPITCGGVTVRLGDVVVADEDGIVVVPAAWADEILTEAQRKLAEEAEQTLDGWEAVHGPGSTRCSLRGSRGTRRPGGPSRSRPTRRSPCWPT